MIKVAIVGGGGFIGKNLALYLISEGFEVLVINKSFKEEFRNLGISQIQVDVCDTKSLLTSTEDCFSVIWLVNGLVPSLNVDSLIFDFESNLSPIIQFLEARKNHLFFKKFIFISSGGTVYGESYNRNSSSEIDIPKPISVYGLSKLIAENYISFLTCNSNFASLILRPSNVYGRFLNLNKPQGIIGFSFDAIINKKELIVYDNGKSVRDFIHVDDLSKAIKFLLLKNYQVGSVNTFNIGSGQGISISSLLKLIEEITGLDIYTLNHSKREFDCDYNVLNIERIKSDLNWSPEIALVEGLESSWKWFISSK